MPSPSRHPLPDAPDLLVYPALWRASLAAGPIPWPDQFRALCDLAAAFLRDPGSRLPPASLGPGERMLLHALATVDVDATILAMAAAYPDEPNPLQRLDPGDSGPVKLALVS